jgi:hypothetical protein
MNHKLARAFHCTAILLSASATFAAERADLRPLQFGPAGEGRAFAAILNTEAELGYKHSSSQGNARSGATSLSSAIQEQRLEGAAGYIINPSVKFISFAHVALHDASVSSTRGIDYSYEKAFNTYEIGAGPSLRFNGFAFGGTVSVLHLGEETRLYELEGEEASQRLDSATMPFMTVYGGIYSDLLTAIIGFKTYNQAKVNNSVETASDETVDSEGVRSRPGEVWFDVLLHASTNVDIGATVTIETKRQGAITIREEHAGLSGDADNGDPRNTNEFSTGLGGAYRANERLTLLSSLQFYSPSYEKLEYASLLEDNMGGYKITVGSTLDIGMPINFMAGYLIPTAAAYDVDDVSATPWAEADARVTLTQPQWVFGINGSLAL